LILSEGNYFSVFNTNITTASQQSSNHSQFKMAFNYYKAITESACVCQTYQLYSMFISPWAICTTNCLSCHPQKHFHSYLFRFLSTTFCL